MSAMRAKMYLSRVDRQFAGQETFTFYPVTSKPFGPNGESEDNTYARYSPSGELKLTVTNPNLLGKFKEGQKFYLDFTEALE